MKHHTDWSEVWFRLKEFALLVIIVGLVGGSLILAASDLLNN